MPAAIAIPLIIGAGSAGASLVSAKMASNASKNAAKTQELAVDKAQQFNQQAYNDQRAALAPYLSAGTSSLADLQARYGSGKPLVNRFAPTGMTNEGRTSYQTPQQLAPNASGMTLADMQQRSAPPASQGPRNYAPNQPLNVTGIDIGTQPAPTLADYSAAMPQGGGQMVTLRAPTGQMARFPAGSPEIQKALRAGAKQVA